jgi:hypothetical protein
VRRATILAALGLVSCLHREAGPIVVNTVTFCQAARRRLPPPPDEPEIAWMSVECPSRFGACLSGADAKSMLDYMRAVNKWKRAVALAEVQR